jgi:hypothetical protein
LQRFGDGWESEAATLREREPLGDSEVGQAFGEEGEHLGLSRRQPFERLDAASATEQLRDKLSDPAPSRRDRRGEWRR